MKKVIICLSLFLCFWGISFVEAKELSQEKDKSSIKIVNHDSLNCVTEHNKQVCEEKNLRPFTGVAMFYSRFGTLISKTPYKNGLVDGRVKAYDGGDGHLYLEANYKQGEQINSICYDKYDNVIKCRCDKLNWRVRQIMKQCREYDAVTGIGNAEF